MKISCEMTATNARPRKPDPFGLTTNHRLSGLPMHGRRQKTGLRDLKQMTHLHPQQCICLIVTMRMCHRTHVLASQLFQLRDLHARLCMRSSELHRVTAAIASLDTCNPGPHLLKAWIVLMCKARHGEHVRKQAGASTIEKMIEILYDN